MVPFGSAQAADTDAPPRTYTVWQWNVAGDSIHHGSTTNGMVGQAVDSIVNRGADFASFNELCENQYAEIIKELRNRNWPVEGNDSFARFEASLPAGDAGLCRGSAFGNALFSKKPLGAADRVTLPTDGAAEQRNLLCAPLTDGTGTVFCTTHITKDPDFKSVQVKAVFDKLATYGTPVIAGDFNVQPHHAKLDRYYSANVDTDNNRGNYGAYRELDDADNAHCAGHGEPTTEVPGTSPCGINAKVDLIFVRESTLADPVSYGADSLAISTACTGVTACSDHRILTGTVTVR
ncbi:endonuclease/exonuclease/phosphatase family protein [Streptomyces sp. ISL-43]|nr:endonuclease/exonuclease/phosphatase family protein [Streptomyces sp. ISL-43]